MLAGHSVILTVDLNIFQRHLFAPSSPVCLNRVEPVRKPAKQRQVSDRDTDNWQSQGLAKLARCVTCGIR